MSDPVISGQLSMAQLLEYFRDYADYDLVDSIARAKVYIHAGRALLAAALVRTGQANRAEEAEFNPEITERSVQRAVAWLATKQRAQLGPRQYVPAPDWRDE